jgi:hypothetical protein
MTLCVEKSIELLSEVGLPLSLLPLAEMEDVDYNRATGFVWLRQKKSLVHTFKQIGRQVLYTTEITAFVEDRRMKRLMGVKSKELLIWVTLSNMFVDKYDPTKITFKTSNGLRRTFPVTKVTAFTKEEGKDAIGGGGRGAPRCVVMLNVPP